MKRKVPALHLSVEFLLKFQGCSEVNKKQRCGNVNTEVFLCFVVVVVSVSYESVFLFFMARESTRSLLLECLQRLHVRHQMFKLSHNFKRWIISPELPQVNVQDFGMSNYKKDQGIKPHLGGLR